MTRKVLVLGKNRLAVDCCRVILDAGDDLRLVVVDPSDDGVDGWQPSLRRAAEGQGIEVAAPAKVNSPDFLAVVRAHDPDLIFSFQYTKILGATLINMARIAALNVHFGPLPRYRGVATIAWALINGERATGATLHHIDPGIDSGDLVAASEVPIGVTDTARTVYDRLTEAGIRLFTAWYPRIRAGDLPRVAQDPALALYYNRYSIDYTRKAIQWSWDVERLGNWIRAMVFPPFQFPTFVAKGKTYEVAGVSWNREPHAGRPGEVLDLSNEGVVVAGPGGQVTLRQVRSGGRELNQAELALAGMTKGAALE